MKTFVVAPVVLASLSNAFVIAPSQQQMQRHAPTTALNGLFDGVKDAFTAPALERSVLDAERETPIDRWMGWSVRPEEKEAAQAEFARDFVDSMDEKNYISVALAKPMGIVFEENDEDFGGIFVQSLKEGGLAEQNGQLQQGDQLVAVNTEKVSGLPFDDALGKIVDSEGETTKLLLFRGNAKQLYGPTGASQAWLDEFIAKQGSDAAKTEAA